MKVLIFIVILLLFFFSFNDKTNKLGFFSSFHSVKVNFNLYSVLIHLIVSFLSSIEIFYSSHVFRYAILMPDRMKYYMSSIKL